jgi:hypothetical protein
VCLLRYHPHTFPHGHVWYDDLYTPVVNKGGVVDEENCEFFVNDFLGFRDNLEAMAKVGVHPAMMTHQQMLGQMFRHATDGLLDLFPPIAPAAPALTEL